MKRSNDLSSKYEEALGSEHLEAKPYIKVKLQKERPQSESLHFQQKVQIENIEPEWNYKERVKAERYFHEREILAKTSNKPDRLSTSLNFTVQKGCSLILLTNGIFFGIEVRAVVPENAKIREVIDINMLKAIYKFYSSLPPTGDLRLEFNDFKVIRLAYKDRKLVLLILENISDVELFELKSKEAAEQLETEIRWEEILPKIYSEYFQPYLDLSLQTNSQKVPKKVKELKH